MLSYEQARNFIAQAARFGSVLGLENMKALMEVLGNPQNEIPIIHIAGTNGKGSVGAYLASILKESGLKVGRYCSPAVFDPLECWQYDGRNILKEEYANTLSQVKNACDILALPKKNRKEGIRPTVFEIETAMAFVYFKQMQVDVLVLETGLGGATDATNVIERPYACVFTTISRDHMQLLGETLEEIAEVKAGIIKKGAFVFSAQQEPEVCRVLNNHMQEKVGIKRKGNQFQDSIYYVNEDNLQFLFQKPGELFFQYKGHPYKTTLSGIYQMRNAALAIEVALHFLASKRECSREKVSKNTRNVSVFSNIYSGNLEEKSQAECVECGVANTSWPGRFEVIGQNPLFIIDGAHNEDAVKQLAITIENSFTNQSIDFIIGILADKEHEKMLEHMVPFARRIFTVTPPNARGLDGKLLAEEVQQWHKDVVCCETIDEAMKKAIAHGLEEGCPILAFGSLSYLGQLKECYRCYYSKKV